MRRLIIAAAIAGLLTNCSAAGTGKPQTFVSNGGVTEQEPAQDGSLMLSLWEPRVRYRIPGQPASTTKELATLLMRSIDEGRAISVTFDAARGRIEASAGTLEYPACAVALESVRIVVDSGCTGRAPSDAAGEQALALAYGYQELGDHLTASRLLARAAGRDDATFRRLLLFFTARNEVAQANAGPRLAAASDRLRIDALAHYRAVASLEPDDPEHRFSIADLLAELGAYREARSELESALAKWPYEKFRVLIKQGALSRAEGDYAKALEALDRLERDGEAGGMRYHYHRGWTLSLLRKFDEAIAQYSEGLKAQPDYASAFQRRACALASVGRLKAALADFDRAAALLAALPGGTASKWLNDDIKGIAADRARVAAALAGGGETPVSGTCAGEEWTRWERPRPRSALLPPVPGTSSRE